MYNYRVSLVRDYTNNIILDERMDINVGDIVYSLKGHDSGSYYLVVGIANDNFVLIADGDNRRLDKPKLKNVKHLKPIGERLEVIAQKLVDNKQVYDNELKRALRRFNQPQTDD